MRHYIVIIFIGLFGCSDGIEPDQRTFVIESLVGNGDLSGYTARIRSYDPEASRLTDLNEFIVTLENKDQVQKVQLLNQGNGLYKAETGLLNSLEGEDFGVKFTFNSLVISGNTSIPVRPDSMMISNSSLQIGNSYQGEFIELTWVPRQNEGFFISLEADSGGNLDYPTEYLESLPLDQPRIQTDQVYENGQIRLNPWDFDGPGSWKVILNYSGSNLVELIGNPVQGYILEPTNGLDDGLGYFSGVYRDTILVTVSL